MGPTSASARHKLLELRIYARSFPLSCLQLSSSSSWVECIRDCLLSKSELLFTVMNELANSLVTGTNANCSGSAQAISINLSQLLLAHKICYWRLVLQSWASSAFVLYCTDFHVQSVMSHFSQTLGGKNLLIYCESDGKGTYSASMPTIVLSQFRELAELGFSHCIQIFLWKGVDCHSFSDE